MSFHFVTAKWHVIQLECKARKMMTILHNIKQYLRHLAKIITTMKAWLVHLSEKMSQ